MYAKTTKGIEVRVRPIYLREYSSPAQKLFVWAYEVEIENKTSEPVQLLGRFWQMNDSNGVLSEIRGSGVVGEQPLIGGGKKYQYSSFTRLQTPSGKMSGSYKMMRETGECFDVLIPEFPLRYPCQLVDASQLA